MDSIVDIVFIRKRGLTPRFDRSPATMRGAPKTMTVQHQPKSIIYYTHRNYTHRTFLHQFLCRPPKIELSTRRRSSGLSTRNTSYIEAIAYTMIRLKQEIITLLRLKIVVAVSLKKFMMPKSMSSLIYL